MTVVLDTRLTPELIEEGVVREIISKVQTMRKDSGFEVTDHIRLGASGDETTIAILKKNAAEIAAVTLVDEFLSEAEENGKAWKIADATITISVSKV